MILYLFPDDVETQFNEFTRKEIKQIITDVFQSKAFWTESLKLYESFKMNLVQKIMTVIYFDVAFKNWE